MERSAAELRGEGLRAWRLHAGLSSAELARRLPAAPASVTMWETGARASRASSRMPQIRAIAEKLELPADEAVALEDMWFAAGSVTLGFPRTRWAHNFPDPPGLAWAWLRPGLVGEDGSAVLTASGWWSEALQGTLKVSCGAAGMLLQFPTTIPNPPLEVSFAVAGWADFGRGRVPAEVASHCGALLMDARDIIGFSPPRDAPLHPEDEREVSSALDSARRLAADLGLGWRIFAPHIGMIKPRHLTHALDGSSLQPTAWPGNAVIGSDGSIERQALMSAAQLRDVREGRGLSRQQVADQASRLNPLNPITARTIEIMETTGRLPNVAGVVAALDHVYRCDGRLGIDQVSTRSRNRQAQAIGLRSAFPVTTSGRSGSTLWGVAPMKSASSISSGALGCRRSRNSPGGLIK